MPRRSALLRPILQLVPALLAAWLTPLSAAGPARDLDQIQASGVLRHLGIPYANFVTGMGSGFDVELVKGFADSLGVRYEFVDSTWSSAFGDLTGRNAQMDNTGGVQWRDEVPIRGDILASGVTILPWRQEIADFSAPTFPTGVWLVARAETDLNPIQPSGSTQRDIEEVRSALHGRTVLAMEDTCLDPDLYRLRDTGATVILPKQDIKLNEIAPAILNAEADMALLDVPDILIALEKWPGQLKVIGPISEHQFMGAAFRKDSPRLRQAFNDYLERIRHDGTYHNLVKKYFATVFPYYSEFFQPPPD